MSKSHEQYTKQKLDGLGLGLRFDHFDDIFATRPSTAWFEVIAEDFLEHGPHHHKLLQLRRDYPIIFHSVGLNLAGVDPIDSIYLKTMKALHHKFEPCCISDHLCWSMYGGVYHHDLLPFPRTNEALHNVCTRIDYLQNYFHKTLSIENITSYIDFTYEDYSEIEFLIQVQKKTDCTLLLDISNTIINHKNRKQTAQDIYHTIHKFPIEHVSYIHLSGGSQDTSIIMDTHKSEVCDEDIRVLEYIYQQGYNIPAMIERDQNIPPFHILETERKQIEKRIAKLRTNPQATL